MARSFDAIDDRLRSWIASQSMFFVATAPLAPSGHVNVSPKGPISTFGVIAPRQVAYLDFYGSGAETIGHLRENARIVIMFCAFAGAPRIVRLHGRGRAVWPDDAEFGVLTEKSGVAGLTDAEPARRALIVVDVTRISDSCGYGVPLLEHVGEREHYDLYKRKRMRVKGVDGMRREQAERNLETLDGLPAVEPRQVNPRGV